FSVPCSSSEPHLGTTPSAPAVPARPANEVKNPRRSSMVSPSEKFLPIIPWNSARNNKHSFHTQGFRSQPRLPARTRPSSRRLSCHFHLQIAVFTRNTARVITCDLYFSPPAFSFFHGRKLR